MFCCVSARESESIRQNRKNIFFIAHSQTESTTPIGLVLSIWQGQASCGHGVRKAHAAGSHSPPSPSGNSLTGGRACESSPQANTLLLLWIGHKSIVSLLCPPRDKISVWYSIKKHHGNQKNDQKSGVLHFAFMRLQHPFSLFLSAQLLSPHR